MIKKIYTTLIIVGLFGICNVFAYTEIKNCYNATTSCGVYNTHMPCREIENNEEFTYDGVSYKVDNNVNFYTRDGTSQYNKFIFDFKYNSYYEQSRIFFYRGDDNKLKILYNEFNNGSQMTFNSGGVCIVNSNDISVIANKCGFRVAGQGDDGESCVPNGCNTNYLDDINLFYATNGGFDKIYFLPGLSDGGSKLNYGGRFCFVKGNTGYCLLTDLRTSNNFSCNYGTIDKRNDRSLDINRDRQANLSRFKESPFDGTQVEPEEPETGNNQIIVRTGKNYYCPTFGQLLEMQPSNYNTGLCYNGTLKYENGQITTVQKQDIQTVFTDYQEYQQYIYLYNNYCTGPATQQTCENAFNGEREKYSIIANAMNNKVDDKELWNYCNIWLNYDLNATTCVASQSGYIEEKPTQQELIDYIENLGNIGEIKNPTSGNILNSLIGSGDTREEIATRDLFGQLDQIKEKVSTIFNERNGVNGVIPDYILWLILTTLLLTVLFKK